MRPLVTSGGVTIIEASGSIAELSTVEKNFQHTYTWKSKWLGSTKRIELKGDFVAKAGYNISGKDLARPFSVDISEDGKPRIKVDALAHPAQQSRFRRPR